MSAVEAPCQFTEQEIVAFADKAEKEYAAGTGMMSHPDFKSKPMYTVEEYFDGLAKDLGEEFGMTDIREAL